MTNAVSGILDQKTFPENLAYMFLQWDISCVWKQVIDVSPGHNGYVYSFANKRIYSGLCHRFEDWQKSLGYPRAHTFRKKVTRIARQI